MSGCRRRRRHRHRAPGRADMQNICASFIDPFPFFFFALLLFFYFFYFCSSLPPARYK
jgi:hypothetical protein